MTEADTSSSGPLSALTRLRSGNERFVKNLRDPDAPDFRTQRRLVAEGQSPFAVVLSCSDSRVPSELVFDCGLGDLFVVRVAGNIVAPSLIGSVEFAAAMFDTSLVVVMGHTRCGAIKATLGAISGERILTDNLRDIIDRISPSMQELVSANLQGDALMHAATRANVRASASHLRHASRLLEGRVADGRLLVVGAEYDLDTGRVDFFDVPDQQGS